MMKDMNDYFEAVYYDISTWRQVIFPEDKHLDKLFSIYEKLKDKLWNKDFLSFGTKEKQVRFGRKPKGDYSQFTFEEFVNMVKDKEEANRQQVISLLKEGAHTSYLKWEAVT